MAVKVIVPPNFPASKQQPTGKPDGHQLHTAKLTMRDWISQDQAFKESQPQAQYS